MKRAIIIIKQPLERIPPIMNLIDVLVENAWEIDLIATSVNNQTLQKYENKVNFVLFDIAYTTNKLGKIFAWLNFRQKVLKYLEQNSFRLQNTMLWVGSADAAIALGDRLFKYKYVFQCHELYDAFPFYQKRLKKVMQNAVVNVNPEENRGAIFRSWYKLKETPVTLPNKPYYHPEQRELVIENEEGACVIKSLRHKKILLYQGGIGAQREIRPIAQAVEELKDEWILVLMGYVEEKGYLTSLLKDFPQTVYIPPIAAPKHLQVTSWARIGILSYSFDDINHVFCAPNKTWEYTGFGIPVLGSDVPGIMHDINKFKCGISVNMGNGSVHAIVEAIKKIDSNYEAYSKNADKFYKSVNISDIVLGISDIYKYANNNSK